ncbi:sugar O-acetyltransferase [Actinomyces sp. 2119]|uniref:sugar O-acetyltransferase n=1 Tax=Actinomyces sp. 2119 TaxID=2321393 RepID=UPI000E6B9E31|nr:sugar O-acetyltransferase [Actinomyces sp. 2119]RJF43756.1 sugar O-acetyltransferase [Actinomyces sp. 2119]
MSTPTNPASTPGAPGRSPAPPEAPGTAPGSSTFAPATDPTPATTSTPGSPHNPYVFDEAETRRRLSTGELYTDFGPGLEALEEERDRGKELVERYNATSVRDPQCRVAIATELFASLGQGTWLEAPIYCAYGSHTSIGAGCWFNTGTTLIDDAEIRIGDRVLFGPYVTITTAGHPVDPGLRSTGAQFSAVVTIEDEAWLGANVTVLPGVTVGRGSVVAAGAVVTANVPPMTVVAGVPARIVRSITETDREVGFRPPPTLGEEG